MKLFSFSLCFFCLIFLISNQFIKNNNQRNLDDEKNIIEIEIYSDAEGEVKFLNGFSNSIEKMYVNNEEMTEKKTSISMNINETKNIKIKFQDDFNSSCMGMFCPLVKIKKIKFINFSGCTHTPGMFQGCSSLESLDLSTFDTSKVGTMGAMFMGCSSLKSLDLSTFDTSNVYQMINLFANCPLLESLDLSSFNTSKVQNMKLMFSGSYSLYELKLSNSFTMEAVTQLDTMFSDYYLDIIQNGANLKDEIKNSIIELKNFIYIVIFSEESKNIKFINYNPENTENIIMLINGVTTTYTNNIAVNSGRTVIKLMIPEENKISCDGLFKGIPEIKKIVFKNFDICNSASEMFS